MKKKLLSLLLAAALCLTLLGCQTQKPSTTPAPEPEPAVPEVQEPQGTPATETENLVKLCKVWGYTKYMHPAFLLGKKDWDQELLKLIPQVRELTTAEEVNALLHDWFVGLGEIDYGSRAPVGAWSTAKDEEKVAIADTSWTKDTSYLGEALAADFAQFPEALPNVSRKNAPVVFDALQLPVFDNEPEHDAAYDDPNFRLLGLFRMWNTVEYYFPYLHLMDRDWEAYLTEFIPLMLEGTDQTSYETALISLAAHMQDSHVKITEEEPYAAALYDELFGRYIPPVPWLMAEGQLVVAGTAEGCPLEMGDVLLKINGTDVETLVQERGPYYSYNRDNIAPYLLRRTITRSQTAEIEVTVLRDGQEKVLTVAGTAETWKALESWPPEKSHQFLEGNIGLINPLLLEDGEGLSIMEEFQETDGIIVDLRQYPNSAEMDYVLCLIPDTIPVITFANPAQAVPGAYVKETYQLGYPSSGLQLNGGPYANPVVVLINEVSISASETDAAMLGESENVTLIGSNTTGSNGDVVYLPLPGGLYLRFTSLGVYTPDGQQTQRTGIAPDIRVEPTIQGIAEGRDEVLEAAVEYIKNAR